MNTITSLIPHEHLGKLVTLQSLPDDLKVLSEDGDEFGAWQRAQWSIAVTTWLVAMGKSECAWLYTPTETVYSEADWYKGSLTEALGGSIETISEGTYTVSLPGYAGYLCISQSRFTWRGKLYRALILGNGDPMASALDDYFIIEA